MEIAVESPEIIPVNTSMKTSIVEETINQIGGMRSATNIGIAINPTVSEPKVSALSLASIKAKRDLQQANKSFVRDEIHLPTEAFTETEMLLHWNKYAQRLGDKGQKIMESLLLISDPKLDGTAIRHELPNEGSRIDFEDEKNELQGYLRGKLQNHDITINVFVNESVENKFAFSSQDKFNRLNQINPTLEVLKKTFDLDL